MTRGRPLDTAWIAGALATTWLVGVAGVARGETAGAAEPAGAAQVLTLPLAMAVLVSEERPVVTDEWIDRRVVAASRIFAAAGVSFGVASRRPLPGVSAAIETREDRDALGEHVVAGAVNCFIVGSLRDVDEPDRFRRGVHWRSRTFRGAHYVILSAISGETVLAHELGHFFGNREHSQTPGNVMSYRAAEGLPSFDARQIARILRSTRRSLRSGEIRLDQQEGAPARPGP